MKDMTKSIGSIVLGWLSSAFLGLIFFKIFQNQILSAGWGENVALVAGIPGFLGVILYVGYFGMRNLHFLENGVPLIIGQRVKGYKVPPGRSWWFPHPFGGIFEVYVGQKTLDKTNSNGTAISKVLSKDNYEVGVSTLIQWTVCNPYLYSELENPESAFQGLIERNVRWYIGNNNGEEIPPKKKEIADMIQGKIAEISTADNGREPTQEEVPEIAKSWGIKIDHVMVDDVNLPSDIVKAWEQKRIEASQQEYEQTEMDTVQKLMGNYRAEFPDSKLSDEDLLNTIQAERGKIKRIVIDGKASDLVKAGQLAGGRGDN